MAGNLIQIKRSSTTAIPTSLYAGELAYSNVVGGSGVLYIGSTDGASVIPIGGARTPGTLTANQALVANSTSGINKIITANLQVNYIEANGAGNTGTAGYVLFSGGSGSNVYWASTGSLSINVDSTYTWTNTHAFQNTVTYNGQLVISNSVNANGSIGTAGYVMTSGGSGQNVYWSSVAGLGVNSAAQYTWSNTQTFQNTITFSTSILANTINATSYAANVYNSVSGGFLANSSTIALGNSTINATIAANTTTVYFTGTSYVANNANNLGGVAASNYVTTTSINANVASYLPTYSGIVNASSHTVGAWGSSANAFIANSSFVGWGNNSANVVIAYDVTGQYLLSIAGNQNNYIEAVIWNANSQSSASADFIINDNLGTYSNNYIDIGINSTGWSNTEWTINGPSDGYVYTGNTNLAVGTASVSNLVFFTGGPLSGNERARITSGGNVGINNTAPMHKLSINGTVYAGANLTVMGNTSLKDVTVSGNLVVTGSVVTVNTTTLMVNDNIIELGFNNGDLSTDLIDTGFFSPSNTSGSLIYSGIARIAASSNTSVPWFKIFNTATNPNTGLTVTSSTTGVLQAYLYPYGLSGGFVANSSNVQITANGTFGVNFIANSLTLTTALLATYGGTGVNTYTTGDILYAGSTNPTALSKLSIPGSAANGQILTIVNNLPAYATLDGGTF
jgi:hypothetical protein